MIGVSSVCSLELALALMAYCVLAVVAGAVNSGCCSVRAGIGAALLTVLTADAATWGGETTADRLGLL